MTPDLGVGATEHWVELTGIDGRHPARIGRRRGTTAPTTSATPEAEASDAFREKMVAARSRDTVRSRSRTGKPARQLKTAWHDAWDDPQGPGTLPMPLMGMVSEPAFARIERDAAAGNEGARELVSYFVGQGVGLVEQVRSSRQVVQDFREEFIEAAGGLAAAMDRA